MAEDAAGPAIAQTEANLALRTGTKGDRILAHAATIRQ